MTHYKILVVATSRRTRGGITAVVRAHEAGTQWQTYRCCWIETHRDGYALRKMFYLVRAWGEYALRLPFCDLVHIHVASQMSALRKLLFFLPAKALGKKIICHFHPPGEMCLASPLARALYRRLFLYADLTVVLSEQWRRWLQTYLGVTERVEVLYNPCPKVTRPTEPRSRYILMAGTLIERKGYADLIHAFARLAPRYPDWNLILAGNGEVAQARALSSDLGIAHRVRLPGWVSGRQKAELFGHAAIYCLASDGEGFPMGVLDAWAYGIACVVTPVGGLPDIVHDGVNGLVCGVHDIKMLTEKLEMLMRDATLREAIVSATDREVATRFDVNHIDRHLGRLYRQTLNSQA